MRTRIPGPRILTATGLAGLATAAVLTAGPVAALAEYHDCKQTKTTTNLADTHDMKKPRP